MAFLSAASRCRAAATSTGCTTPPKTRAKVPSTSPSRRRSKRCSTPTPDPLPCRRRSYPRSRHGPRRPPARVLACAFHSGEWRNGRRARFRSVCPKGRGGSTPPSPTLPRACSPSRTTPPPGPGPGPARGRRGPRCTTRSGWPPAGMSKAQYGQALVVWAACGAVRGAVVRRGARDGRPRPRASPTRRYRRPRPRRAWCRRRRRRAGRTAGRSAAGAGSRRCRAPPPGPRCRSRRRGRRCASRRRSPSPCRRSTPGPLGGPVPLRPAAPPSRVSTRGALACRGALDRRRRRAVRVDDHPGGVRRAGGGPVRLGSCPVPRPGSRPRCVAPPGTGSPAPRATPAAVPAAPRTSPDRACSTASTPWPPARGPSSP